MGGPETTFQNAHKPGGPEQNVEFLDKRGWTAEQGKPKVLGSEPPFPATEPHSSSQRKVTPLMVLCAQHRKRKTPLCQCLRSGPL